MRYILIVLLFFYNVACTNVNKAPKEILQKESIPVPSPTSEKPKIPQKTDQPQNTSMTQPILPPKKSVSNIQMVGIYRVAAYLAEVGYFDAPLREATLETVKAALKSFQRDIPVASTGILDDAIWDKLQRLKLSHPIKAELKAITKPTTGKREEQFPSPPVAKPVKSHESTSSAFKPGESVYAIEKIECKGEHEAFMLIYQGKFQSIKKNKVQVRVNKRYAMWYDSQKTGKNDQDWWCIPKKRFCYSHINLTDWGGQLKSSDVGDFEIKLIVSSHDDMMAFMAQSAKKACSFE
jgi:hypothetical protein